MAQIGLTELYYALLDTDPLAGTPTYQAPVRIVGAITANINPNASSATLFADDGPFDTASTLGDIELSLNVAELSQAIQAVLLGHTLAGGILKRASGDTPPWLAIGFKSLKSNGSYRYTWLNKGKFSANEQANETKGDTVNFQTPTIIGNFVSRTSDTEWERHTDEDNVDYVAAIGTSWFTGPLQTEDTTPPTIASSIPVDEGTGIALATTVAITFSEALALSTITTDNFVLTEVVAGTVVAGALTVDTAREVVTFTPTADLTTALEYRMSVSAAVTDVYGNKLVATSIDFTTV